MLSVALTPCLLLIIFKLDYPITRYIAFHVIFKMANGSILPFKPDIDA